jgi:hypothetical protein
MTSLSTESWHNGLEPLQNQGVPAYKRRAAGCLQRRDGSDQTERMRFAMAVPTQARALEYFNYDPSTGALIIRERPKSEFDALAYARHLRNVGKAAGSPNKQGYIKVLIDGHYHSAHRVIWLIVHNEWPTYPEFEIDHINGDRSDNRDENLRKATKSQNQRNAGQRVNNTSGIHGVNWKPRHDGSGSGGGWVARIWSGPRHVYLGQFQSLREAQIARKAAERVLGYKGTEREPKDHKAHALRKRGQA